MSNKPVALIYILASICFAALLTGCEGHPSILNPKGVVSFEERQIIFDTTALMLIVVIPVIIMSLVFSYHYRASNRIGEYKPDWHHSTFLEALWWGVPFIIILILASITWVSTHKLDPYRTLNYPGKINTIKVIALPWKWLFIYDDAKITTVNKLVLPKDIQTRFLLTSDNVPMSAFFIPQLGGQIYTMAGMQTKLHLIPTTSGSMTGFNSQYNGNGFADMHFEVSVLDDTDYKIWLKKTKSSQQPFTKEIYKNLRKKSHKQQTKVYSNTEKGLFSKVIHSYRKSNHPNW
jgi:cytochrome o ubiquinol oxidase subunit II